MWRSDPALLGPVRAVAADIDPLNRIFSDAFTERYRRDGLSGVRVPFLNPVVWQFAIDDAHEGAMLWRDARGDIVAFNMVHRSGSEGWMGPLAVRTDRQGEGHGARIVRAGIAWLQAQGARTIGLETMPRTIDNIGFYSRLGFLPNHLTVTLQRDQLRSTAPVAERLSRLDPSDREVVIAACRALTGSVVSGVDFTREIELTLQYQLGDLSIVRDGDRSLRAMALWHTAPLAQGRPAEELRILKLVATDTATAVRTIAAVEREAAEQRLARLSLRCQTRHDELYAALIADSFRVQWTDLRMSLRGHGEQERRGVMLSNWEI
jgi:GNAT superfamily N-acetyltransferase